MRFIPLDPPRAFEVGHDEKILLRDCGRLELEPDEQVTFTTPSGADYDVARKSWGFYATPSLNGRLVRFGLRAVMVKNRIAQFFVLLVEHGHDEEFRQYVTSERLEVIAWLDDPATLARIEAGCRP